MGLLTGVLTNAQSKAVQNNSTQPAYFIPNKGQFKKNPIQGKGFTFGAYSVHIPARPFLRPAIEDQDNINTITELINTSIKNALSK